MGGIALAFAAQDVLQNLLAGVLLQVRRPFRIGDQIRTGDHEGVVEDVNLRTVEIRSYDGLTILVPNNEVLSNPIINYTDTPFSRSELVVGVAYSTRTLWFGPGSTTLQVDDGQAQAVRDSVHGRDS